MADAMDDAMIHDANCYDGCSGCRTNCSNRNRVVRSRGDRNQDAGQGGRSTCHGGRRHWVGLVDLVDLVGHHQVRAG